MIQSFRDKDTHSLFLTRRSKLWSTVQSVALRKLDQLQAATSLEDLRAPPGNRLEPLQGERKGQHSIRINDQWRICFTWQQDGAYNVEIVDYHG
jgi:proteic killer suppression protein